MKTPTTSRLLAALAVGVVGLALVAPVPMMTAVPPSTPRPVLVWFPLATHKPPRATTTPTVAPIADFPVPATTAPPARHVKQQPHIKVEPKTGKPPGQKAPPVSRATVTGVATWYCWPSYPSRCTSGYPSSGAYAAAGPELRQALGHWRGKSVWVNGVRVTLIDWCACNGAHVVDVYHSTWLRIPHQSSVTITW